MSSELSNSINLFSTYPQSKDEDEQSVRCKILWRALGLSLG